MPPVVTLGTPDFNYLLLRSNQTPLATREKASDQVWPLFEQAATTVFDGNFQSFYESLWRTFFFAQLFHVGFYYSSKDGHYQLVTPEFIEQYIPEKLNQALITQAKILSK